MKIDRLCLSLLFLYRNNFLDSLYNIKPCINLPKFIGFNLGIIQQVLNSKMHQVTGVVLGQQVLFQLFKSHF